jgi:hypothetical protein
MSGLSTKNVKEKTGGGVPKLIQPGEHVLKINNVQLKRLPHMEAAQSYYFVINVETEPIEGFEGFYIDNNDHSLGRYAGQIGEVKASSWPYKDVVLKSGTEIWRDEELLREFKLLAIACDGAEWFESVDEKYNTIEEFCDAFNAANLYQGKLFRFCVAGKEYEKKDSTYPGMDLHFPKPVKDKTPVELADVKVSTLIKFDESKHWIKLQDKPAESAGTSNNAPLPGPNAGAPEFQL